VAEVAARIEAPVAAPAMPVREKVRVVPLEDLPPEDPFQGPPSGDDWQRRSPGPQRSGDFVQRHRRPGSQPVDLRRPRDGGVGFSGDGDRNRNSAQRIGNGQRGRQFDVLRHWDRLRTMASIVALRGELFAAGDPLEFSTIFSMDGEQLAELVRSMGWERTMQRRRILATCLERAAKNLAPVALEGFLDFFPDGNGCLVPAQEIRSEWDAFVPRCLIRGLGLRRGQSLRALAATVGDGGNVLCVLDVETVMGRSPAAAAQLPHFKDLVPYYPTERVLLENDGTVGAPHISLRIVDLLSPIGLGQRGLIVAPPRTGKTMLLQALANGIATARPNAHLLVLLVDERPEEVTDFRRTAKGEVFASTFDEAADSHITLAELVVEAARRRVECGEHVIILLDSITRLARAYNAAMPVSGRILTGGMDATALQGPKTFFGSARNIEGGGSLTILGTALIETGSRMDDVIFEEFKGTGNMELYLNRELAEKRIYPAIDVARSGTRKEELLYHPDELSRIHTLRRALLGVSTADAMDMVLQRVKKTRSNTEFLLGINR
jgi:transcription termination factor Rho